MDAVLVSVFCVPIPLPTFTYTLDRVRVGKTRKLPVRIPFIEDFTSLDRSTVAPGIRRKTQLLAMGNRSVVASTQDAVDTGNVLSNTSTNPFLRRPPRTVKYEPIRGNREHPFRATVHKPFWGWDDLPLSSRDAQRLHDAGWSLGYGSQTLSSPEKPLKSC